MRAAAGTETCRATHNFYVLSGRMRIAPEGGEQFEVGPGDVVYVAPGHDAWTLGDDPCVCLDWTAARKYAR